MNSDLELVLPFLETNKTQLDPLAACDPSQVRRPRRVAARRGGRPSLRVFVRAPGRTLLFPGLIGVCVFRLCKYTRTHTQEESQQRDDSSPLLRDLLLRTEKLREERGGESEDSCEERTFPQNTVSRWWKR